MEQVGYDMYCKLLDEVVKEMQGFEVQEDVDVQIDLNISSYIPDEFISDSSQKIEIYQDIAVCETEADIQDIIDEINILNATKECMKESFSHLTVKPDLLLVDAVKLNICENEKAIIKGDATSYAIACASIIAKVYRDRLMAEYAVKYPNYDFENNVGYGTKKHIEGIKENGITPIHRLSFLSKIIGEEECKRISMERQAK